MRIISHRGYWKDASEKNQPLAFERSFSLGYGTETDLRDYNRQLVIAHDMADENSISLNDFFSIYKKAGGHLPLALNIKADGLQNVLNDRLAEFKIDDYFVFDMSIPDTIQYMKLGIRFFSRQSEYEREPVFYDKCSGVWLDAFTGTWYDLSIVEDHAKKNKQVAIVSPELHKRDQLPFWEQLKKEKIHLIDNTILCTDFPEDAEAFFK
ncbi:MAG: hypothetical protein QM737_01665 [Ferruginibacter sp.]